MDVWSTGIFSNPLPYNVQIQADGNLVLYDNNNVAILSSNTNYLGQSPFRLILQNGGVLTVIDALDTILWHN